MNRDCLKLTAYFGERDRDGGGFVADGLVDLYAQHGLATSVLLRGIEGFGAHSRLQTQRLLSLSEDLPIVSAAVDTRERIEAVVPAATELVSKGLVTLERARMLTGELGAPRLHEDVHEETKLTVYCGRREPFPAVVEVLRSHGVAGATVLLGVDGTVHGERRRARFFAGNSGVPLMIMSVGRGEAIAGALPELGRLLERPLATIEKVTVCKRDGVRLADPPAPAEPGWRQKVMVYGTPSYARLIRRLRERGASGASALRGIWGYHGDHRAHGDRILSLRREAPVLTVVVDEPERVRGWFDVVDEETAGAGLVTSELVPGVPSLR